MRAINSDEFSSNGLTPHFNLDSLLAYQCSPIDGKIAALPFLVSAGCSKDLNGFVDVLVSVLLVAYPETIFLCSIVERVGIVSG